MEIIKLENTKLFIENEQKRKFIKLLEYLKKKNKFYKNIIPENLEKIEISDIFKKIPIIDKEVIKKNYNNYFSYNDESITQEMTSGTTGVPLKCLKTVSERNIKSLIVWKKRKKIDLKVNIRNFLDLLGKFNNSKLNILDTSEENMKNVLDYIEYCKPRWLCASPSVILIYAKFIVNNNILFNNSSIKYIELQGESIKNEDRLFIEEVLNVKTVMNYGNRENWCIAYECMERHLHINTELFILENGYDKFCNQENGKIILTDLTNKVMPFIRYDTSDLGSIKYHKRCSCGEKDVLEIILSEARTTKRIIGQEDMIGDLVFKRIVHQIMRNKNKDTDIIYSYKVIQKSINNFIFFIVPGRNYTPCIKEELIFYTKKFLKNDVVLDIKLVDFIPLSKSGKKVIFDINIE